MRNRLLILTAIAASISAAGYASDAPTPLENAHAPTLASLGDNVIRVTTGNSMRNPRISSVELHLKDESWAVGSVTFYVARGEEDWIKTGRVEIDLPSPEYSRLAEQTDELLASYKQGPLINPDGEIVICTDGPIIVVERRIKKRELQFEGGCGHTALVNIADLILGAATKRLALYGIRSYEEAP